MAAVMTVVLYVVTFIACSLAVTGVWSLLCLAFRREDFDPADTWDDWKAWEQEQRGR